MFQITPPEDMIKSKGVPLQLYIEESVFLIKSYKFMEPFNTPNH